MSRRNKHNYMKAEPEIQTEPEKPLGQNVFLYIQLARIRSLPETVNKLEIHIEQGDSTIVKCEDHYNTDGIIYQEEFESNPTFTLVIEQDNIDRINQISNNPLLIKLYMRITPTEDDYSSIGKHDKVENKRENSSENSNGNGNEDKKLTISNSKPALAITNKIIVDLKSKLSEEHIELLSIGYIDLIKLFLKRRAMIKEELYLYSVPNVPNELRITTHSEWHLYTLLPLLKEVSIANLSFITFESIYNIKREIISKHEHLVAELYFRSTVPNERNEYEQIPLCNFKRFILQSINEQSTYHVFESFRREEYNYDVGHGLFSNMKVELHKLFKNLMNSAGFNYNFNTIDTKLDMAYICNSFHRYALTHEMSNILCTAIACNRYVIGIDVFTSDPRVKLYEGQLQPLVLAYPYVTSVRFAVELSYVGQKPKAKKFSARSSFRSKSSVNSLNHKNTTAFGIIKICLFSPLDEINDQLNIFRESFVSQNRLQFCDEPQKERQIQTLDEIRNEVYSRFDRLIDETINVIILEKIQSLNQNRPFFCCTLQNFANILLKVIGCDFNQSVPTTKNVEFTNVCVDAYNVLECRLYDLLERFITSNQETVVVNKYYESDILVEYMNAIKLLRQIGEDAIANFFYEKVRNETKIPELFSFYNLIYDMERNDYESAKKYFNLPNLSPEISEYLVGWIKLFLRYKDNQLNKKMANDTLEYLLRDIEQYAECYAMQNDGWILLYCYYNRYNYLPGTHYARWHFEDYSQLQRNFDSKRPYSLAGIYLKHTPRFHEPNCDIFFDVARFFVRLGLYEFANCVLETIERHCSELDRYLNRSALNILMGNIDYNYKIRTFQTNDEITIGLINQINGSIEYMRGNMKGAEEHYLNNINISVADEDRDILLLSVLRLTSIAFANNNHDLIIRALGKRKIFGRVISMVVNYLLGKAYYFRGNLQAALQSFAQCTTLSIHWPSVWGYLALINLRLKNTLKALECWKYAKINPIYGISEEIYDELDQIDYDDVDLYVDKTNA